MWLVELFAISLVFGSVLGVSVHYAERWMAARKTA